MSQTLDSSGVKTGRTKVEGNIEKKKVSEKQTNQTLTLPNIFWTSWVYMYM